MLYRDGLVAGSRKFALLAIAGLSGLALLPSRAHAQWWTAAPADFEDCAERAEKSVGSKDAKSAALSHCESKFAGRRKAGGGYAYYDFMQNRSFDIAGPNPSAAEQKMIDEQYTRYLDDHRRTVIVAAFAEQQRQQVAALPAEAPLPPPAATKETKPLVAMPKPRPKGANCAAEPLACGWSRLSDGLKDLKKTLFGAPAKTKGG